VIGQGGVTQPEGVVERITAVQIMHGWDENRMECACGYDGDVKAWDWTQDGHAEHVAGEVAKALQLTEDRRRINPQTRAKPCDDCGHLKGVHFEPCRITTFDRGAKQCGCREYRYTPPETSWESRLVSPWVSVPQQEES
jgi:hypothetical protein